MAWIDLIFLTGALAHMMTTSGQALAQWQRFSMQMKSAFVREARARLCAEQIVHAKNQRMAMTYLTALNAEARAELPDFAPAEPAMFEEPCSFQAWGAQWEFVPRLQKSPGAPPGIPNFVTALERK